MTTHPDDAAFRAAIAANPADALPRLIYADHLAERGDDRAAWLQRVLAEPDDDAHRLGWGEAVGGEQGEFVRVQCELAALKAWAAKQFLVLPESREGKRIAKLRHRERELWNLRTDYREWAVHPERIVGEAHYCLPSDAMASAAPNPSYLPVLVCRRGFFESATLSWTDWLAHHATILDACPIRHSKGGFIELTDWPLVVVNDVQVGKDGSMAVSHRLECNPGPPLRSADESQADLVRELLARRWPGVAFRLPPAQPEPHVWMMSGDGMRRSVVIDGPE